MKEDKLVNLLSKIIDIQLTIVMVNGGEDVPNYYFMHHVIIIIIIIIIIDVMVMVTGFEK